MATTKELQILPFASVSAWAQWLAEHHQLAGVWIKMAKKASGITSITHDQALDVALCYGWIDGQRNSDDDCYFLRQRVQPWRLVHILDQPNKVWFNPECNSEFLRASRQPHRL